MTNDNRRGRAGDAGQASFLSRADEAIESEITITAKERLRVFLYAGEPVKEPVAAYGPFAMNTQDEIWQTILDYQMGKFDE
ncbi:MAG: pirin-like C-terminal cupin domain-containing protein [Ectobacillus sp.]